MPSGTETLFALGAAEQVVGRTLHDKAPEVAHLPSVGTSLEPSLEALLSLRPDLVITWDKSGGLRQRLDEVGVPTYALRARDTSDVLRSIGQLGHLVGRADAADSLSASIRRELEIVRSSVRGRPRPSVLYVVWHDPPRTAGPRTFIAQVIGIAGGETVFPDLDRDWPELSMEEIVRRQPDVIVLPVGDGPAHSVGNLLDGPGWRSLQAVREGRVVEVPSDLMNRPGPHLGRAARVMRDALHSELRAH